MNKSLHKWFGPKDCGTKLLSPLQELNRNKEEWSSSVDTLVAISDDGVECQGTPPPDVYGYSKKDAEETLSTLARRQASAHAIAQSNLIQTAHALRDLQAKRESNNVNKAGVHTQKVLSNLGDFLASFSGIAEIVKSADQQFGGLAYGTVMVLANAAVNKAKREDIIEEVLEELTHAFPRLNILQYIEPRESLRTLIVGAFELTIRFCRETTEYLNAASLQRTKKASSPAEMKMVTVARLRTKLLEIHKACEILTFEEMKEMRKELSEASRKIDEMKIELSHVARDMSESTVMLADVQTTGTEVNAVGKDTNNIVREGRAWMEHKDRSKAHRTYLSGLKSDLGLKTPENISEPLSVVNNLLRLLSEDQEQMGKSGQHMDTSLLKTDASFQAWYRSVSSSLLVIGGNNFATKLDLDMNWLSAVSVWTVQTQTPLPSCVLSFFCQQKYMLRDPHRNSFWHVVKTLVYQLAHRFPDELVCKRDKLATLVDIPKWIEADYASAFENAMDVLEHAMQALPEETELFIVIDRLDQCHWRDTPGGEANKLVHAVAGLLHLIRQKSLGHITVKLLLTMDHEAAERVDRAQRWARGLGFESKVDWHQEAAD